MRAKVKERRKERKSRSFPAEIAASLLKLHFRLQFFQIKQNCAAFRNSFVYSKSDKLFSLRQQPLQGRDQAQEKKLIFGAWRRCWSHRMGPECF